MSISGWLFDVYPLNNKMVFWIKQNNGNTVRLEDKDWSHSIYVASSDNNTTSNLNSILKEIKRHDNITHFIKDYAFVSKYEKITDTHESEVLKLNLSDSTKTLYLAKKIERIILEKKWFEKVKLYNVDMLPEQSYFYEHNIFPLAFCKVYSSSNVHSQLRWTNKDNVYSVDYKMPDFRTIHLKMNLKIERKIPRYTDRINSISIITQGCETFEIQNESEIDTMKELTTEVAKIDPDFIFTEDGDSFTFPYLIHRAEVNGLELVLGREPTIPLKKPMREGISYFSYGRVYFRPTTIKLLGRIHLDKNNSFVWNESGIGGLQGLYEIARLCRMPLHTASRASIGKCLSSLQFYYATVKKNTLIPWKPTLAEHFKTFENLFIADRGGLVFEPEIGVHEQVAEFDFISLYPNIMLKKNISAETINCDCCYNNDNDNNNSNLIRVPELTYYHICEKRTGIVPMSLKIVLDKRKEYKQLLKFLNTPIKLKSIYDARQNALKWILVTSFGYLGFNNAKFGRIDAHIAVCAFDRQIILQAAKIAERYRFRVLHGIVDSIWIRKKKKKKKEREDDNNGVKGEQAKKEKEKYYLQLKKSIEKEIGFEISFEGIYQWVAFVPSKINSELPVTNRYFGVFENGDIKVRGIEARRHDTPIFLSKFQQEILKIMATGNTIDEIKALMTKVTKTFQKYVQLIKDRKVPVEELVFTKQLSKDSRQYYGRNTVENNVMHQLEIEGQYLKAGQVLRYIITDYYYYHHHYKEGKRSIPIELINENITYDVKRYIELLAETCNSVTAPFGYVCSSCSATRILSRKLKTNV
jgi:DNA polymerase-2